MLAAINNLSLDDKSDAQNARLVASAVENDVSPKWPPELFGKIAYFFKPGDFALLQFMKVYVGLN